MEQAEIFARVRGLLADSMALDPEAIRLESALITELGLDSLDLLDTLFSLEEAFGVELRDDVLEKFMRGELIAADQLVDGKLSVADKQRLGEFLPALADADGEVAPREVASYLTVQSLVIAVARKL